MNAPQHFDVVVIGGGLAGSVAANRAAELGLSVALLERGSGDAWPCNSRYSGGILHIAFRNVKDTPDSLLDAINAATGGDADPRVARALVDTCGRAVDWLQAAGAKFMRVGQIVWQQWMLAPPRSLTPGLEWKGRGPDVTLRVLAARLRQRGGRIFTDTAAVSLLEQDGRCVGVEAVSGTSPLRFHARAVIIADGGFQANLDMVRAHIARCPERVFQRGASTGFGDGLRMAQVLGAAVTDLKCFYGHLLSRDSFTNPMVWPYPQLDELGTSGIVIDNRGCRVADEGLGGVYMANRLARLADPLTCFAVFDEKIWQGPGKAARIPANPNLTKGGGTVHQADSLAELAGRIGVPPDELERTVRGYNAAYHAGALAQLTPPRTSAVVPALALEQPPYYAVPLCAGITYTMGGIATDGDARVLKADGSVLPGLYAAGVTAGGLEGGRLAGYVGGLIQAAVFGLRSAEHAAHTIKAAG